MILPTAAVVLWRGRVVRVGRAVAEDGLVVQGRGGDGLADVANGLLRVAHKGFDAGDVNALAADVLYFCRQVGPGLFAVMSVLSM